MSRLQILVGAFLVLLLVGGVMRMSRRDNAALPTAAIKGVVTYRGQPLNGGYIRFVAPPGDPVGQHGGDIRRDGSYGFHGAPIGKVKIAIDTSIRPAEDYAPRKTGDPRPFPIFIPAYYADPDQSGLTFEMKPGKQVYNIELN